MIYLPTNEKVEVLLLDPPFIYARKALVRFPDGKRRYVNLSQLKGDR